MEMEFGHTHTHTWVLISDLDNLYNFLGQRRLLHGFICLIERFIYIIGIIKKYDKIKKRAKHQINVKLYNIFFQNLFKTENVLFFYSKTFSINYKNLTIEKNHNCKCNQFTFRLLVSLENENYENQNRFEFRWNDLPENFEYFVDEIRNGCDKC